MARREPGRPRARRGPRTAGRPARGREAAKRRRRNWRARSWRGSRREWSRSRAPDGTTDGLEGRCPGRSCGGWRSPRRSSSACSRSRASRQVDDAQGTIGAAKRYNAGQLGDQDVQVGDTSAQEFLQSDTFAALVKDPDAVKLLGDPGFAKLLTDANFARALGDPGRRESAAPTRRSSGCSTIRRSPTSRSAATSGSPSPMPISARRSPIPACRRRSRIRRWSGC